MRRGFEFCRLGGGGIVGCWCVAYGYLKQALSIVAC